MEIDGATLPTGVARPGGLKLTSLRLPDGSISGGLLLPAGDAGDGPVFLLFADRVPEPGEAVGVPPSRRYTVTSVRPGRFRGRRVTVLRLRRTGMAFSGPAAVA